ncbi:MAG: tetratricopeptide repeat protein [Chthoniobacteraceae bacterium]
MSEAPHRWIESTAWELPFFGLPNRIPWPNGVPDEVATRSPFEMEHLLDAIDTMGDEPGEPWASFRDAADALDELAEALEDTEVARATELINQFEGLYPGTAFALYHLGMIARLEGREDDALKLFREAADKTTRVPALWNNVGMLLAMRGERDEAIAAFKRVLEINPRDATALEGLAQLRAIVKVVRDAKDPASVSYIDIPTYGKHMVQQLNALGNKPEELLQIGGQLLNDGLIPDLGVQAIERAAELQPNDQRALMALASACNVGGKKEKARETLVRYTELFPEDPRGFFGLAQSYAEEGAEENEPAELAALEKVLELDPNAQPAIAIYFDLSPTEHDPEKEEALTEFAAEHNSWMGFILASDLARRRGDATTAIKWAARAHDVNPDSEDVLLQYTGAIGEARDFAKLASIIKPRVEEGKFSKRLDWAYAHVLHQLGLTKDAIGVLRKAAASEGVPDEFKQQAATVIDAWNGMLTGCGVPLEVHQTGFLIRPVILTLDDDDGGVVLQAGVPLPASGSFPWRATGVEARVSLQQGQNTGTSDARLLGTFLIREVQPKADGPTTVDCHLTAQRDGAIHFRAVQDGRKLRVGWMPPAGSR